MYFINEAALRPLRRLCGCGESERSGGAGALEDVAACVKSTSELLRTSMASSHCSYYGGNVASMAYKLHAIEQMQLRERRRVDSVGRPRLVSTQVACAWRKAQWCVPEVLLTGRLQPSRPSKKRSMPASFRPLLRSLLWS